MMSSENSLTMVMEALVSSFERETIEENQEAYLKLQEQYSQHPEHFLDMVELTLSNFATLVENVMDIPESEQSYILEHIISGVYKHFHTQRIEKLEGSTCCYDKSTYIEAMTIKALKTQQNLSLYADYTNVEQIKNDKKRQAFWSPTSVKDTDEAIELFWKWYMINDYIETERSIKS